MQLVPVYAEELAGSLAGGDGSREGAVIDTTVQRLYGIQVEPVSAQSARKSLQLFGRIQEDETRVYKVEFGTDGYVKETHGDAIGTHVMKDQRLGTVYSPDFLSVAGGYLAANERSSGGSPLVHESSSSLNQNAASAAARADRLRNLGMSDAQIEEISRSHKLPEDVYLVSPVDGVILSRSVSPGMRFERHDLLYSIADLSRVWINAEAFGRDADDIRVGTRAKIRLSDTNDSFPATVTLVSPEVDPATRAVRIRLEAANSGLKLRPGAFVNVEFDTSAPRGLSVPLDAVVESGHTRQVFVRTDGSHFAPHVVRTGMQSGNRIQILDGLHEGDEVVSAGTFLIDSEARLRSASTP